MVSAIIVAAGKGTRMGPEIDKLFIEVAGKPVVAHTWHRFDVSTAIDEIIIVVRQGMGDSFAELATHYRFQKPFQLVVGGQERQDSVWNGLQAVDTACEIVAIHDGARPCTPRELIASTVAAAREFGAAVAAHRVADTLKESQDGVLISRNVDRSKLWAVQTPQTFRLDVIKRALEQVRTTGAAVTDDTAACELIGYPVRLVTASGPNPKVTSPADIPFIESLLQLAK